MVLALHCVFIPHPSFQPPTGSLGMLRRVNPRSGVQIRKREILSVRTSSGSLRILDGVVGDAGKVGILVPKACPSYQHRVADG